MTDQINHRAEAADWLDTAARSEAAAEDHPAHEAVRLTYATVEALIGIGHALLAAFPADPFEGLPPASAPVWQEDRRPHSRACGFRVHPHGNACHSNCPTCGGQT
jgi:hypothetical protein